MRYWVTFLCFCCTLPSLGGVRADLREGGKLYNLQKYGQALDVYNQILKKQPQNAQASFGAGASAYFLKDYAAAEKAFTQSAQDGSRLQQDALFNLGNTYYRANDKEKAVAAYKQAILKNPKDKEAIHNLQLVLSNPPSQNNQNKQNNQNQDKNSPNQDNKDQSDGSGQSPQDQQQEAQQQPQPQQMNQDDAERILQMARNNEKKAPSQQGRGSGNNSNVEKDW